MGYFESITESNFKEGPSGEILFYPQGILSRGRIVPDEEARLRLFNFQKGMYQALLLIALPYLWIMGALQKLESVYIIPAIVLMLYLFIKQYLLVKDLKTHKVRLGFMEVVEKNSKTFPNWLLMGAVVISILGLAALIALLIIMIANDQTTPKLIIAILMMVMIGGASLALSLIFYYKKNKSF